jgi:hypothetical protein
MCPARPRCRITGAWGWLMVTPDRGGGREDGAASEGSAGLAPNISDLSGGGGAPDRYDSAYFEDFALQSQVAPSSWLARLRRGPFGVLGDFVLGLLAVAAVAFLVVKVYQTSKQDGVTGDNDATTASYDRRSSASSSNRSHLPPPQLFSAAGVLRGSDEPLPLGVSVRGATDGAALIVYGLAPGSALSSGRQVAANTWRIENADVTNIAVRPPSGFAGVMKLVLELRLGDDTIADRRTVDLAWTGPPAAMATNPAATTSAGGPGTYGPGNSSPVQIDRREIDQLIARGESLMSQKDIASARLVLQRAADAGDARGALTLGTTYDPMVLDRLGVRGRVADVDMARAWYERAKALGSAEAPRRIELLLATRDR